MAGQKIELSFVTQTFTFADLVEAFARWNEDEDNDETDPDRPKDAREQAGALMGYLAKAQTEDEDEDDGSSRKPDEPDGAAGLPDDVERE